jgi:transposase
MWLDNWLLTAYRRANMYIKRAAVKRGAKHYVYLRLVQAFRDEAGKVRHRVLATLGREDELKKSGQLDQLAAAFTRLDPPRIGVRREVGPLLLVREVLQRLDLVGIVDRHCPQRGKAELTTGEVIAALVANRLCAPAPLYDIAAWGAGAALHEVLGIPGMLLNDDRLGRALEALAPVAESVRGAMALAAVGAFGTDAARLHLDLTTLRVAGAYEASSLVSKGWGAERRVARQVRVLQAVTPEGVPLYVRPHPGDAAELTCIGQALEQLTKLMATGLVVCADSALGHIGNLCGADRAGLRFVVPLRADTGFSDRFLKEVGQEGLAPIPYVSQRDRQRPRDQRAHYRGALRPFPVVDPKTDEQREFRVLYVWSSEEASSVAEGRERALTRAETDLAVVRRGLGGRFYKTKEQVDAKVATILIHAVRGLLRVSTGMTQGKPTLSWQRDQDAIAAAARCDGVYALATNIPGRLSPKRILHIYKNQWVVEQRHRDAKQTLRVRPIFLHNDDRIEALVSVVGLALLVFGLIENAVRKGVGDGETLVGLLPEGRPALPTGRAVLAAFQGLQLTYTSEGIRLDQLTATQRRILQLLDAQIPWAEHQDQPFVNCGKRA